MWMTEFRPRAFRTASEGIVENLDYGIENCAKSWRESDNGKNRAEVSGGDAIVAVNCTSSKRRRLHTIRASTRFVALHVSLGGENYVALAIGLLTRTTSISSETPIASGLGQRKYTPVELIRG